MINTNKTKKAMIIAYNAHHGQKDRAGVPYIFHPIHLAEQMNTEEECIVALLHDVMEDTDITFEKLSEEFPVVIMEALKLLTHNKDIDYMNYVASIKSNPIARQVKLADLNHNSDETRLEKITSKDIERFEKYRKAIKLLSN